MLQRDHINQVVDFWVHCDLDGRTFGRGATFTLNKEDDISLKRFTWLLEQRGYEYYPEDRLDEKIKVLNKRPDFYVETRKHGTFLVEIKSFKRPGPLPASSSSSRVMASDPEEGYKRIRNTVMHAADQLRPYKNLTIPMLVILDNYRRIGIPSNILDLRNALFGTLEIRRRFDPDCQTLDPPRWHHGKGQRLNSEIGKYISAVAWNLPKNSYIDDPMTKERPMYLRMVHNPFAEVGFPIQIFNNGDDKHYGYDEEGGWISFSHPSI